MKVKTKTTDKTSKNCGKMSKGVTYMQSQYLREKRKQKRKK